jgi:hypothetical protein
VVRYGRAITLYKCSMVFLLIIDVWIATSLLTLKSTEGLRCREGGTLLWVVQD